MWTDRRQTTASDTNVNPHQAEWATVSTPDECSLFELSKTRQDSKTPLDSSTTQILRLFQRRQLYQALDLSKQHHHPQLPHTVTVASHDTFYTGVVEFKSVCHHSCLSHLVPVTGYKSRPSQKLSYEGNPAHYFVLFYEASVRCQLKGNKPRPFPSFSYVFFLASAWSLSLLPNLKDSAFASGALLSLSLWDCTGETGGPPKSWLGVSFSLPLGLSGLHQWGLSVACPGPGDEGFDIEL